MKKYGFLAGFYVGLMIIFLAIGDIFMHLGDPNYHASKPVGLLVVGLLIGAACLIGYRYQKAAGKQVNPLTTEVQTLAAYADNTKATPSTRSVANAVTEKPTQDLEQSNDNQLGGANNGKNYRN